MSKRKIEAKRVVDGLRLYRRGLRQLENGKAIQAATSAAAIAEVVMDEYRRLTVSHMFRMASAATMKDFDRRAEQCREEQDAEFDLAERLLRAIMEGGREEEARRIDRLAASAPWYRWRGIIRKAETRLAVFVDMVKETVSNHIEAGYRDAAKEILGRMDAKEEATA